MSGSQDLHGIKLPLIRALVTATTPTITAEERIRRENACRAARASVVLEGFEPSQEEEDRARRFIAGEMGLEEFVGGHLSEYWPPATI